MIKVIKRFAAISLVMAIYFSFLLLRPVNVFGAGLCPSNAGGSVLTLPGCGGDVDIFKTIQSILNLILFAAFLIALAFLIFGGIKWIVSGGEKDSANKARDTVTSALIGLAVVLGSFILINVVAQLITGHGLSQIGNQAPSLSTS